MKFDTCEVIVSIGSQLESDGGVLGRPNGSVLPYAKGTGNVIFQVLVHEPGVPSQARAEEQFKSLVRERFETTLTAMWNEIQRVNGV